MKNVTSLFFIMYCLLYTSFSIASPSDWAIKLCKDQPSRYDCARYRVRRKPPHITWSEMFSNAYLTKIMIAINRRNTLIWNNHILAMPKNWSESYINHAPFLHNVEQYDKHIVVDLKQLAWAAYDQGKLIDWGPANGGMKRCKETGLMKCKTHTGLHFVLRLDGPGKKSDLYPPECEDKKKCGHPMPYYMPFHRDGTGLHGNKWLTGRNSSHGCVRLLKEDARWLNKEFVEVGTPVMVLDY